MTLQTNQTRCPFCNAPQPSASEGSFVCDFCLQPYTTVDARREQLKLVEEIKTWVQQRVGGQATGAGVDASSRAYIFQQRVLPDLRRDVDRAVEAIGPRGQRPLVLAPIPAGDASSSAEDSRDHTVALKRLRARLESETIATFAVMDGDREALAGLDRDMSDLVHLLNTASAAANRSADGYAAARRNLEILIAEIAAPLSLLGSRDAARRAFLLACRARYQGLAEHCRIYEEIVSASSISGESLAVRIEALAVRHGESAQAVQDSEWSPADAMPLVLGIQDEVKSCLALVRWLRAYDAFSAGRAITFPAFVAEIERAFGTSGGDIGDVLEPCALAVRAARGEVAGHVIGDFDWITAFSESSRSKKALGLFGTEERLDGSDSFLVPAWLAVVSHSRASGTIFKTGEEARTVALVEACSPHPDKVVLLSGEDASAAGENSVPQRIPGDVALPNSSRGTAARIIGEAIRSRFQMPNAVVNVQQFVFLPAAVFRFASKRGERRIVGCLGGRVPVDESAAARLSLTRDLIGRLARI